MALTIQSIRCRCEEVGECWIWRQGVNSDGQPNARDGRRTVPVRRRVWELTRDREVGRGYFVLAKCGDKLCVSPTCAIRCGGKLYMHELNRLGKVNGLTQHVARTIAVRARSKLKNAATATQIKQRVQAGEDRGALALEFGISRGHLNRVARGEQWASPVAANSIFHLAEAA